MTYTLYQYPRCSTCVKARKWLEANHLDFEAFDLTVDTPDHNTIKSLHARSSKPIKAFFNTSGQSYRRGDYKTKLTHMTDEEKFAALAADGMLIKRPILVVGDQVLVGFKEAEWSTLLEKHARC